jgi:mannose-6-phosphate isomerase-like protein (cupin superfamily)
MTKKVSAGAEYYTEERCHIIELHNTANDPNVSIAQARVEPGVTTAWHRVAGTEERYLITHGQGCAEVDDAHTVHLIAGESITIPAGARQRIRNTGETDLVFLCVCTPRFDWNNYESLEP